MSLLLESRKNKKNEITYVTQGKRINIEMTVGYRHFCETETVLVFN